MFKQLLAEGMPPEGLEQVHAPIGLDIGAVTPEEIAVSILCRVDRRETRQDQEPRCSRSSP